MPTPPAATTPGPRRNDDPAEVARPGYWGALYRSGETGWDKGTCAPPIRRLLESGLLPPGSRVAVPGCGLGHEAEAAARLGFETIGFDFAPEAIRAARARSAGRDLPLRFVEADLFTVPESHPEAFDGWIEHTCFCAIDPARRPAYVEAARRALKPAGLFLGLFYTHGEPGGPPYDTSEAEIMRLVAGRFDVLRFETPPDSFPNRQGKERLFVFRKQAPRA